MSNYGEYCQILSKNVALLGGPVNMYGKMISDPNLLLEVNPSLIILLAQSVLRQLPFSRCNGFEFDGIQWQPQLEYDLASILHANIWQICQVS